jgi:hypothetical protein
MNATTAPVPVVAATVSARDVQQAGHMILSSSVSDVSGVIEPRAPRE